MKLHSLLPCLMALLVAGCVEPGTTTSGGTKTQATAAKLSPRAALREALAPGGVSARLDISVNNVTGQQNSSSGNVGGRLGAVVDAFGASASTNANIPSTFELKVTRPEVRAALRESGQNIYVYADPNYWTEQLHNGTRSKMDMKQYTFEGTRIYCAGYYMVLGPHNDYQIRLREDKSYTIRRKADGIELGGIFGTPGKENWVARNITGQVTIERVAARPFTRAPYRGNILEVCAHPDARPFLK